MSKVIICIHGIGNKPSPKLLSEWWRKSIHEGLNGIGKFTFNPGITMIYWADVLHNRPLDENITNREDPNYLEERYTPADKNPFPVKRAFHNKIFDILEKEIDKILLNDDMSINLSFVHDLIIHKYFKELEIYYSGNLIDESGMKQPAKKIIRERAAAALRKHKSDQILLIAHSMGSIIAYDVLTNLMPELNIDTFITIGSPLGFPLVKSKTAFEQQLKDNTIKKLKTPPGISRLWYNFSDNEDRIAMHHKIADDFEPNSYEVKPIDITVENNYEINGNRNPHKSYGYLRAPELSQVLYDFLTKDRSKLSVRILEAVNFFYSKK